jgi:hypothetical protein
LPGDFLAEDLVLFFAISSPIHHSCPKGLLPFRFGPRQKLSRRAAEVSISSQGSGLQILPPG